jgi:hypothetical protein
MIENEIPEQEGDCTSPEFMGVTRDPEKGAKEFVLRASWSDRSNENGFVRRAIDNSRNEGGELYNGSVGKPDTA